ncbi:MAG: hypothetical protein LUF34_10390 [Lachnospiraceae bacterium]|nr:hypothetical protein [Lachnospiraceae bacterium]
MLFIEYPRCSTCKKAKKWLDEHGILYKELKLKDRLLLMSEEEQLQLLASNGMLVKRPVVVDGDTVTTGFKEAEWEEKYGMNTAAEDRS